jgi:hypothetical protein
MNDLYLIKIAISTILLISGVFVCFSIYVCYKALKDFKGYCFKDHDTMARNGAKKCYRCKEKL